MRSLTFSMPFLPPPLDAYRNDHWRKQRGEGKTWKDYIAVKWAELGRPKLRAIRIDMIFSFPDQRCYLDNYLATGSKLVGDAVKGLFIPEDSPEHLTAWSFRFEFGDEAKTTVVIEEADGSAGGRVPEGQAAFWEDHRSAQSKEVAANAGNDAKRSAGERFAKGRRSGRQAAEAPEAEVVTGCPVQGNSCRRCPLEAFPSSSISADPSATGRPACSLYEMCIAPLCPMDRSSLNGIWYPDEEICHSRTQGNPPWLKAQRRLSRVAASGYFTVEMMNRLVVIRKGITGLDPNVPEEQQLRTWFQKRSDKQDAPPEAKADRSRHLKKFSFKKQGVREG